MKLILTLLHLILIFNIQCTPSPNKYKVFVYGTLKKGEPNHFWFSKQPNGYYKFIGNATTEEKYPLIIGTKFNIPFLLDSPGEGKNVRGELYEVDEQVLIALDKLEDHPNFYVREQRNITHIADDHNSITEHAWMYLIKNFKPGLLKKEHLESYSNEGEHGLKYVERYLRSNNDNWKVDVLRDYSEESTIEDLNSTR